jgi:hypothetical protein
MLEKAVLYMALNHCCKKAKRLRDEGMCGIRSVEYGSS